MGALAEAGIARKCTALHSMAAQRGTAFHIDQTSGLRRIDRWIAYANSVVAA
jgi:hypothetical protein